jgi:hypothetical protein
MDLELFGLKGRELQMDIVVMRLEEMLEVKIPSNDLALFKKEFESFYLVPLETIR